MGEVFCISGPVLKYDSVQDGRHLCPLFDTAIPSFPSIICNAVKKEIKDNPCRIV